MKVRLDFVTNSSSSCYICEVCRATYSGWDMGLSDAQMMECVNSHVVCQSHLAVEAGDRLDGIRVDEDSEDEFPYNVPAEFCPICSLEHVRDEDMLAYVLKMAGAQFPEKDKLTKVIGGLFKNLGKLREWCDED